MSLSSKKLQKTSSSRSSLQENLDKRCIKRDQRPLLARPPPVTRFPPKIVVNAHKSKKKYFTSRSWVTEANERDVLHEPSPFRYPQQLEEPAHRVMTKTWRRTQRALELGTRFDAGHNHRSRQNADLLNRLHVDEPQLKDALWIQDIDREYFTIIQGRPVPEKLNLREYIDTIREVLKTKIVAGYRGDDVLLLEQNLMLEQKHINEIEEGVKTCTSTFEEFLYKDHCESMKLINEADKQSQLARVKYEEFRDLSKEFGALKAIVTSTEEKWRNCKQYQRFLYLVSPMFWRREHDFYYKREQQSSSENLQKHKQDGGSLDDLIDQFQAEVNSQDDPILYFTDPQQLLDVFKFIELQNLNSLLHSEELAAPLEQVKESIATAEVRFIDEIAALEELIAKLEGGIKWEEERASFLKELALELVRGEFRDLVVAEDVLNMYVFVEDVYETRIGPNDANLTIGDMMAMVEGKFREELIALDQLPAETVTRLEQNCYQEEAKLLKTAQAASRKLAEFELLFQKLEKVFAPPVYRTKKELKWRSPPVQPPKVIPPPPRELTEKEQQYLQFFTDYCKHTDTPKQYGIDVTERKDSETRMKEEEDKVSNVGIELIRR